eukprot:12380362-Heterocapsa_arctica.AAC.1
MMTERTTRRSELSVLGSFIRWYMTELTRTRTGTMILTARKALGEKHRMSNLNEIRYDDKGSVQESNQNIIILGRHINNMKEGFESSLRPCQAGRSHGAAFPP